MGNANSSISPGNGGQRERMTSLSHEDVPELALLAADESFSSQEDDSTRSLQHRSSIPIHWNVRLRAVDQSNNECPVCAREFEANKAVALLPCGHYFCKECIQEWMSYQKCTCPICRCDLKATRTTQNLDCSRRSKLELSERILLEPKRLFHDDHDRLHMSNMVATENGLDRNFDLIMAKMLNGTFDATNRDDIVHTKE